MSDTQLDGAEPIAGLEHSPERRHRGRVALVLAMAVLVVAAAVGVAATGGRGADKPTRVVVAPAIRAVSSAVAATVTAQRWDMSFADSFQPSPGGSAGIGASITGHGTTNLDPFAMVAYATVPGFGQVTTMMSGSLIWEFGAGNYGISAGPAGPPGASIAGFAPLVEGTLGAEDGAVAMLGLGSSTGYLNLVQAAISGATRTGTATVGGVAVTIYRVTVDPTRLAGAPGITPGESAAVADALRLLAQDGSPPIIDTLAVDDSGRIREIDQVVTFADGGVATQHTTLSNFDCAPTVVLPGSPPPTTAGPCGTPSVTAPLPTPPPSQSSTTPTVDATAASQRCDSASVTVSTQGAFGITGSGTDCPTARAPVRPRA